MKNIITLMIITFLPVFSSAQDYKDAINDQVSAYEKTLQDMRDFEKTPQYNPKLLDEDLAFDVNLGDKNAPIRIVEYLSLSCAHCKQFHQDIFYKLKENYIDTGKVFFKIRQYPLNGAAAKAAILVDCAGDTDKLAFIGALFESQVQWAFVKNEAGLIDRLKTLSKIGGLDAREFEKCYNDDQRNNELLTLMKRAYDELRVSSTPAIFVEETRYVGSRTYEAFAEGIDKMIADKLKSGERSVMDVNKTETPAQPTTETTPPSPETTVEKPAQ